MHRNESASLLEMTEKTNINLTFMDWKAYLLLSLEYWLFFATLIERYENTTYIDVIFVQTEINLKWLNDFGNFKTLYASLNSKLQPIVKFFILIDVKLVSQDSTQKIFSNKIEAIQEMKRPAPEKHVMKLLGGLKRGSYYFPKMHVISAPL